MTLPLAPHSADALLFDLGRVVINFDIERTVTAWAERAGCKPADILARFVRDETFWRYETGLISDEEFFAMLRQSLGVTLSDAELLAGWNATFIGEMPGIAPLLERAATRLPLYAFSNTNNAHVAHSRSTTPRCSRISAKSSCRRRSNCASRMRTRIST